MSCVKKARDRRDAGDPLKANNERIFLSVLKRWNRDSMYTLTLDGAGLLTCDCASLGGLRFDRVDNVVIKNTTFVNYANFVEGSTPEEVAAVMVIGADGTPARNFFIKNCVFNGISIANKTTCSTYTMSCKYIENLTVVGSRFSNNAGITFKLTNAVMSSFVKNVISGVKRTGAVGHPGFFSVTNGRVLMIEDNDMDGSTFNESLVYVSGIDNVTISRNHVHEGARVAEFSANTGIDNITIESNLIVNVLMTPVFPWIQECFSTSCDVDKFVFRGNTLWMGGNNYMQFVCRFNQTDTREAEICNNIIVDPSSSQTSGVVSGFLFKTLGSLRSRNNIFKFSVRNEETLQSYSSFIGVDNPDNSPGSLTVTGGNRYKLSYLVSAGLDSGSALVNKSVKLLDVENGGNSYAITPTSNNSYPPSESDVARFDRDYKLKAVAGNSRGCYNLAGSVVDEGVDATTGYTGQNLTEPGNFDSETRYDNVADCVLLLKHDTIDRERPVKFSVTGTQHRILALGRFAVIHAYPELDVNGEYQADELYTINVD